MISKLTLLLITGIPRWKISCWRQIWHRKHFSSTLLWVVSIRQGVKVLYINCVFCCLFIFYFCIIFITYNIFQDFTEYTNLEECITYLTEYIIANGPFDGFLGFSQGATLSALLIGYQAQGKLLKEHPPIKFFVSISGSKFRDPSICDVAYKDAIKAKSVHFIGEKDWLKIPSEELASAFEKPVIIRHPQGHTVPRLGNALIPSVRFQVSGFGAVSNFWRLCVG